MKILYILILCTITLSCSRNFETEKYQNNRDNIVNVREKVKEIEMGDVLIGRNARVRPIGNYLLISGATSLDSLIHIFDKNNFNFITGIGRKGQGPGEITNKGPVVVNETEGKFYVTDYGKLNIFSFDLDSIIAGTGYMPIVKVRIGEKQHPHFYEYINDTLCIGQIINVTGISSFQQLIAKWNMITGEITPMKYTHPVKMERRRVSVAASAEHGLYIEFYSLYDLMTICSLEGDLKYNVYGPNWDKNRQPNNRYYSGVGFYNNKIIAAYSGGNYNNDEYYPTKFLVFDLNGDYIKTLDVGYKINDFCFDKDNNRIIMSFEDVIQFGYLDLDGLI